jgi:hypothetical protein
VCRSIKVLRKPDQRATADELQAAARQYVRKISGFHKPSRKNETAFEQAIAEITESSRKLLEAVSAAPEEAVAPGLSSR